jgi:hypothetical protein
MRPGVAVGSGGGWDAGAIESISSLRKSDDFVGSEAD